MTDPNDAAHPPYGHAPAPAPAPPVAPAPPAYPAAPGGYPAASAAPAAYPAAPGGYPAAPGGYPAAPGAYGGYAAPQPPHGYPAPAYGYARPTGRSFWALLFLCCIPYLGSIIALIVALVQRSGAKSSPVEIVRENARWAANWMISFVFYQFVALLLLIVVALWADGVSAGRGATGWAFALPMLLILGMGIYCLVTVIIGTVRADRFVHRPVLALPFIRA